MRTQETCPTLTLNKIRDLFSKANNINLSQTTFFELLPVEITQTLMPATKGEPNKAVLSALYRRNINGKIVSQRYYSLKNVIVDKKHGYLNRAIFNRIKDNCEIYIIPDNWNSMGIDDKETTPLTDLVSCFELSEYKSDDELSFKNIFTQLYRCYRSEPSKSNLVTLISYALLCSIFPQPQFLDGYTLPPAIIFTEDDRKNLKSDTFHSHSALKKISSILSNSSCCVLIGSTGCGKESISTAFEYLYARNYFSAVFYYRISYDSGVINTSNLITPETVDNIINSLYIKINSSNIPVLLVVSDWNGKKDIVFRKLSNINNCKFIFLTTNPLSQTIISPEYCIDLNTDFYLDKKYCARKAFVNIYGSEPTTSENAKLNTLLSAIDYHFFTSIILARTLCRKGLTISEKYKSFVETSKIFEQSDILPYTRNLGLDYISGSTLQFLTLLCLTPKKGISKSFYAIWCPKSKTYKKDYNTSLEMSFIQETPDSFDFLLTPHIRQALMALSDFSLESNIIFQSMIHLADMAKICSDNLTNNDYSNYQNEIVYFVELFLSVFSYKPGQFTSAYIQLIRFLWTADKPLTALSYLKKMEESIKKSNISFLETDLAQIHLTMGYICNSTRDYSNAIVPLNSAAKTFAKQYISSYDLVLLTKTSLHPRYKPMQVSLLDALNINTELFTIDPYPIYFTKLQVGRYLSRLPLISDYKSIEEVYITAKKYLDNCCEFFEENGLTAALATSLYTRAFLLKKYSTAESRDYNTIFDDLDRAKQLRASIRGIYHSWMISIYLLEAEMHFEIQSYQKASDYLNLLEEITKRNNEIIFSTEQQKQINTIRKGLRENGV